MSDVMKATMLSNFELYRREVDRAMDAVHLALVNGQWEEASEKMSAITTRQAQVSVSMRAVCVKNGHIKEKTA